MSRFFYLKLALNNLKKNSQTYRAYLLTCIGTIAMFFVMHTISVNRALDKIAGGGPLKTLLALGLVVIAIFSSIFLIYTNSFLIKRRKKEFGLFNILGMEKRHLARIMMWETVFTALVSFTVGITSGMILSKLMFLVLLKLISVPVSLAYEITFSSINTSLTVFGAIFALSFLYNLGQVQLTKPIELLKGEQVGEREPKTRWLLILLGLVSLGTGYYMALTIQSPLQALNTFFVAVLLVMVGTYCLFTAGTVGLLKLLRRNKLYYYQSKHFTAVSGMLFRMKQNAVGLANICILSAAVLVTLSTTLSLYVGVEEQLRARYPREIEVKMYNLEELGNIEIARNKITSVLQKQGLNPLDTIDYTSFSLGVSQEGASFQVDPGYPNNYLSNSGLLIFLSLEDYEKVTNEPLHLNKDEVFVIAKQEYPYETLSVLDHTFKVVNYQASSITGEKNLPLDYDIFNSCYVVVKDKAVLNTLHQTQNMVSEEDASQFDHYLGFDLASTDHKQIEVHKAIIASLGNLAKVSSRAANKDDFYSLNGGFFFVGLFLGTLFLIGTVLIIYYKQITEGYADQKRFTIMQQVGMGEDEVKKAIRSQVLMVFFLPLTAAGIHILFAFKMISKLLGVFNLTNIALFAWCSLGVFLVFGLCYGLVYTLTARIYYKIVRI